MHTSIGRVSLLYLCRSFSVLFVFAPSESTSATAARVPFTIAQTVATTWALSNDCSSYFGLADYIELKNSNDHCIFITAYY